MVHTLQAIRLLVLITLCSPLQRAHSFESTKISPDPDCGAKCLYVILLEQGAAPTSYKSFANELEPASKEGYSLLQLQNAARSRGLFAESCRLEPEDLRLLGKDQAAILHMKPGHFVICSSHSNNQLVIYDAATGMISTESTSFLEKWSGNTLLISKNEIKLPTSTPKSMLSWWWGLSGIVLVCGLAFSLVRWLNRRSAILLIAITPCLGGCETHVTDQVEPTIARIEGPSKATFSKAPKVWIEKTVIDAGRLNLTKAPHVVAVRIQNRERRPIEISDVRVSCNCLSGRISSKTIQPSSTETLELLLERSNAGPKKAMCTIICNGHPVASLSVSWTVTAELTMTPDSISNFELDPGVSKEVAIEIDVHEKQQTPRIQVECVWDVKNGLQSRGVETTIRIVDSICYATFSADAKAQRQTVSGGLFIRFDGQTQPAGIVPFVVSVRTDVDVSPAQLFLTSSGDGTMTVQMLMQTEDLTLLTPFELYWINGDSKTKCDFTFEDQDGTRIVDLRAIPNEIDGVTELEITAGSGFVKRIPAFFPKNK